MTTTATTDFDMAEMKSDRLTQEARAKAQRDAEVAAQYPAPLRIVSEFSGAVWMQEMLTGRRDVEDRKKRPPEVRTDPTMSPLGRAVADILGLVWRGIYHLPNESLFRVKWSDPRLVEVTMRTGLTTFDPLELTFLVLVCHDVMVRLKIDGVSQGYLKLRFFQRQTRDGGLGARMPTIEDSVRKLRSVYSVVPNSEADEPGS